MSKARNISFGLVVLVAILASSHHSSKLADPDSTEKSKREIASHSEKTENQKSDIRGQNKISPQNKKMNSIKKTLR